MAGSPNTDAAWQEALKPPKGADKRRELYLDKAERKRLIDQYRLRGSVTVPKGDLSPTPTSKLACELDGPRF